MEQTKLQQLHDTILKLVPRGKHGGLGLSKISGGTRSGSSNSEDNPLYRYFVRAGQGQQHKRSFDSDDEAAETDIRGKESSVEGSGAGRESVQKRDKEKKKGKGLDALEVSSKSDKKKRKKQKKSEAEAVDESYEPVEVSSNSDKKKRRKQKKSEAEVDEDMSCGSKKKKKPLRPVDEAE